MRPCRALIILVIAGAPGVTAQDAEARPSATAADAQFMRAMIAHHAQAVTMTGLVPARSGHRDLRLLAERMAVSQTDEIATMRRWLQRHDRGLGAAGPDHAHDDTAAAPALMQGILTPEAMARLARATRVEFDRLFLEGMITHHEGALTMVAALFATAGAAQEPRLFDLAAEIDAGQRAEIRRMRTLLESLPAGAAGP